MQFCACADKLLFTLLFLLLRSFLLSTVNDPPALKLSFSLSLLTSGQHDSQTDRGGGLRGVHLQGVGEQRAGRVPHHHGGVGAAAVQAAAEAQQLAPRPEASVAAAAASAAGSD